MQKNGHFSKLSNLTYSADHPHIYNEYSRITCTVKYVETHVLEHERQSEIKHNLKHF